MEGASPAETLRLTSQSTRKHVPEQSDLQIIHFLGAPCCFILHKRRFYKKLYIFFRDIVVLLLSG